MMLTASLLTAAFAGASASVVSGDHEELRHQRHRLENRIEDRHQDLDEISTRLVKARDAVDAAVHDLSNARTQLAILEDQVHDAAVLDQQMQAKLELAIVRLRNARSDLAEGRRNVTRQRADLASYAVSSYQNGGSTVFNLGVAFDSQTAQEAVDTMQAAHAILDKQSVALQELDANKVLLTLTEQRVQATKEDVALKRQQAADNLETKRTLEARARIAKLAVADRVDRVRSAKQEITAAKKRELQRLHNLQQERKKVEARLRKIAERRAREHRKTYVSHVSNGGGYLSYPVRNAYITSPYGMRMHPILHVWKLHDGTDFHANCGTPVYAAASGRVLAEYYNAGYGNRLIMDHGYVKGVSLQTSYNHLTSFVAGSGERVQRGELIAYSGTTGYSTGCHLHFMVYVNGYTVNPVNWL
jgi:murein DD-endopeptidase MepM/ murein hydrolase activator NlpD